MKSLPARPSLASLRKQAKQLARNVAAGDTHAIARTRAHLPNARLPLTQRNAQLVIAREYGYAGWQDLTAEVSRRLGDTLEWAAKEARRAIHDNDGDRLTTLLNEVPALLSWRGHGGEDGLLGFATGAYGDSFDPDRERTFTRAACAELLIDAGAVVTPSVVEGLIQSRARGLLQLFRRKGLLPPTLMFHAALGDLEAVRAELHNEGARLTAVTEAFVCACRFEHEAIASLLLDRSIALDPELGSRVDGSVGRAGFVAYLIRQRSLDQARATAAGPWNTFVMARVSRAAHEGDLTTFVSTLRQEPWLLGEAYVWFQVRIIEVAALNGRAEVIAALFDLDPALLRRELPPPSQAIEFALTYAKPHVLPVLTRVWPLPDDLPHAAAIGNLSRVKPWFDASGAPALGDLARHYPYNDPRARSHLHWDPPALQQVLDVAFAFAVINRHFDVADFLLAHGADINTNWNSHEPASVLHHLVFEDNYESMRYLIDRGIDMTIRDHRWNSTAQGWALYGKNDLEMARWLEEAERRRGS